MDCSMPGFPVLHCLLEFAQIQVYRVSDAIQPSLSSATPFSFLPSVFSNIRVFSNESALHNLWPKYWSFNFSISPSYEYSVLIFFRIDWFDFLAVQGTLSTVFSSTTIQKHQLIPQHSAFFMVQFSHPYTTTGKTIALTICTFVGKVMSLLFKALSRFVIVFLPRSKHLLISWLQSLLQSFWSSRK